MGTCILCKRTDPLISKELEVCLACIRRDSDRALEIAARAHFRSRRMFGLPEQPPRGPAGAVCRLCGNECEIPEGASGYCGLRTNRHGRLEGVSGREGKLSWYHDPLPTNCVADWVCPGGTGAGYPRFAAKSGPEYGHANLAVFFHACSFDCLFCQNWHFRRQTLTSGLVPVEQFLKAVDRRTSCICYFGGDPAPQIQYSLEASRQACKQAHGRILRICWETNGSMGSHLLDNVVDLAMDSGGCIKFDLKAWAEPLHIALTGVTNRRTIENFRKVGRRTAERSVPPLLIASTLLVPGYVDELEIEALARFIASIHPDIPYSLLAFHPHFFMSDLPVTSKVLATRCLTIARQQGLTNVRLGNMHLLNMS